MEITAKKEFTLPNKKVKLVPNLNWARSIVNDKTHENYFLFGTSTIELSAPKDSFGNIVCPLTEQEREFFEDKYKSGMSFEKGDLSPYKKHKRDRTWWESKESRVKLDKNERILDLSNPKDYLTYKILLSNKDKIAPSAEEVTRKRTYLYAVVELDYESRKNVSESRKLREAYKLLDKLSTEQMRDVILLSGKRVTGREKAEALEEELLKMIEEKPAKFIEFVADPHFETRALIMKAVSKGVLRVQNKRYYTAGGDAMNLAGDVNNLDGAVTYLTAKQNQDLLLAIQAQVDEA